MLPGFDTLLRLHLSKKEAEFVKSGSYNSIGNRMSNKMNRLVQPTQAAADARQLNFAAECTRNRRSGSPNTR